MNYLFRLVLYRKPQVCVHAKIPCQTVRVGSAFSPLWKATSCEPSQSLLENVSKSACHHHRLPWKKQTIWAQLIPSRHQIKKAVVWP